MEVSDINIFLGLGALISIGLSIFGIIRLPKWKERGFGEVNFNWNAIFFVSSVLSFGIGLLVYLLAVNPWAAIAIIPLAYMMTLGSITDMKVVKIPLDISILAYWIPVPLLFIFADTYGWISFGVWMALVFMFFIFSYAGAFGMADLRIMILAGTSVVWWVGVENVLLAFGASAFVQLLLYPLANKFNWGVMKQRKSMTQLVKEKEEAEGKVSEIKKPKKPKKPKSAFAKFLDKIFGGLLRKINNFLNGQSDKAKRFVPFGPALYVCFCAVGVYYAKVNPLFISANYGWWN